MSDLDCKCSSCCPRAPKIDLNKPIRYADFPGCDIRVLANEYQNVNGVKGALIGCKNPKRPGEGEALFILDTQTGIGTNARLTDIRVEFKNEPEILVDETFINYYENAPAEASVHEVFDTREEADSNNIFGSRDCCVKLRIVKTDGVWTAAASVEK